MLTQPPHLCRSQVAEHAVAAMAVALDCTLKSGLLFKVGVSPRALSWGAAAGFRPPE